ncbi:hypothetical protein IAD21_00260 [Abditibacteriota bacterium]|nr:hypothetical protein IAD21_00260 [Abditibacteriota bacterium]
MSIPSTTKAIFLALLNPDGHTDAQNACDVSHSRLALSKSEWWETTSEAWRLYPRPESIRGFLRGAGALNANSLPRVAS